MTATETTGTGRLLDTAEVCERLGIGRTKLYDLRKQGHLAPYRIGHRTIRWSEADVDAYLASIREAATSP